jgi:uncharacterized protein (DUF952 family)
VDLIYHITKSGWWNKFSSTEAYESETLSDEGFIHCSTREQVDGVLERYYANEKELLLLHINPGHLKVELKFEVATHGLAFPHVYGKINREAIVRVEEIEGRN